MYSMGGMLEMIKGLRFMGKQGAAFGSCGWSGGAVKQLTASLKECGFDVVNDGFERKWAPDDDVLKEAQAYGETFASTLPQ